MDHQKRAEAYHKSRLGQMLIEKGYINQQQLDLVMAEYQGQNKLLGELLIEARLISRWQLRRALSSQTRLRFAASLSVALLSPMQRAIAGSKSLPVQPSVTALIKPLLESGELDEVGSQIDYEAHRAKAKIKTNGSIRLRLPSSIGELRFDHLRLKNVSEKGYAGLELEDIDLSDAVLSVKA